MATFGSFCLLIALALAAYNLLAGTVALRLIATGQPARISPERLADTARRAGIAGFIAVSGAAFALVWAAFTNDFSITYILEHSNRALPIPYKFAALVERPGGIAAAVGVAAGNVWLRAQAAAQDRCEALCLRGRDSGRNSGFLPGGAEFCRAPVFTAQGTRSPTTATDSIPCSSIPRW